MERNKEYYVKTKGKRTQRMRLLKGGKFSLWETGINKQSLIQDQMIESIHEAVCNPKYATYKKGVKIK